jgi:hypothetical protein
LAKPGDTVLVSGTCRENLAISSEVVRITLDGQGIHAYWRAGRDSPVRCGRGCFGYH